MILNWFKSLFKKQKWDVDYQELVNFYKDVTPVENFEQIVKESIYKFPEEFQEEISQIIFEIQDLPSKEWILELGTIPYAVYRGVPIPKKHPWATPYDLDKVILFKKTIEKECQTKSEEEAKDWIEDLIWHEVGHHFGFNDKELLEMSNGL